VFVSNQVRRLRTRRTRLLEGGCLDRRQVLKREGPRCTKREQADLYDLAHFYRSIWGQYLSLSLAPPAAHLPSSGIPSPGTMLPRAYTDAHPPPARTHTTHTRMHACTHARGWHARARTHTHTHTHTRTNSHTHTRTHAHTHTRTHAHTHTHHGRTHSDTVHTYGAHIPSDDKHANNTEAVTGQVLLEMQTHDGSSFNNAPLPWERAEGPCLSHTEPLSISYRAPVYLIPSPCLSNTEPLSI